MKTVSACQQCREGKRKCRRPSQTGACQGCAQRQLRCSLNVTALRRTNLQPLRQAELTQSLPEAAIEDILGPQTRIQLVDHYLQYIHDRPHSLFHRPSLQAAVRDGSLRSDLLFAICALGSRFSTDPVIRNLESKMVETARRTFHDSLEDVCLESIQTCILLANIYASEMKISCEALYFSIAVRMAHILNLSKKSSTDSAVTSEIKRRVWWAIFMADRWCSSGLGLPRQINDVDDSLDLPIHEAIFHSTDFDKIGRSHHLDPGLWANMIVLAKIFGMIQDLNRQLVMEGLDDFAIDTKVVQLATQLEEWEQGLPLEMKLSEAAIDQHKAKGLGGTFVALHLGYHHYCTLLFFNFLDIQRRYSTQAKEYANRCQYHAISFSWLLQLSRQKGQCEAVYATVGHMAVVSSSVLVHRLLFGEDGQVDQARACLVANFEALTELRRYWPCLNKSVHRLLTFQKACLWSVDSNTHRIDRWMVRFLFEYALPLDEKHLMPPNPPELNESMLEALENEVLVQRHRLTNDVLCDYL